MTEKEKLQLHYDNATRPGTPKALFLGIGDYVKCVGNSPGLSEIVQRAIINERNEGLVKLSKIGETLTEESAATVASLRGLVAAHAINDAGVEKELNDYERVLKKEIQYSSPLPEAIYRSVGSILAAFNDSGHVDLIKPYVKLHNGLITDWAFAPSSGPYLDLLKTLREKHKVSVWGHWDELVRAYEVIEKKDEIMARMEKENDRMGLMNFYGLVGEMKKVLEGERNFQPHYFTQEDFSLYLNRVHTFLMSQDPQPNIRIIGEPSPVKADSSPATLEMLNDLLSAVTRQIERGEELARTNNEIMRQIVSEKAKPTQLPQNTGKKPDNWCWLNESAGTYQFGGKCFTQTGDNRKKVFRALMNIYEQSPEAISVASLHHFTGIPADRIRIEIAAINRRLKAQIGCSFHGSGEGYYVLR